MFAIAVWDDPTHVMPAYAVCERKKQTAIDRILVYQPVLDGMKGLEQTTFECLFQALIDSIQSGREGLVYIQTIQLTRLARRLF